MWSEKPPGQVKKAFCFKNCSDLILFENIVQVIWKFLQILNCQPWICKICSQLLEQFFLTVSQNSFRHKLPISPCVLVFPFFYFGLWLNLSCTRIATIHRFIFFKQVFISPPTCQHLHNLAAMIWKPTLLIAISVFNITLNLFLFCL